MMENDNAIREKISEMEKEIVDLRHRIKVLESRSRVLCGNGKTEYVHILVEEYALEQARKKREAL